MTKNKKKLSKDEILHLADLSNIKLTDEEISKYQDQLTKTLDYVENLNELNTDQVNPSADITDLDNISFEDGSENKRGLSARQALANSKNNKDQFFVANKIFELEVYEV